MKKFLTVLLALSVVFTYSFSAVGTAFAEDDDTTPTVSKTEQVAKLAEARTIAENMVNAYYNNAMDDVVDTFKGKFTGSTYFEDADYEAAWSKVDVKSLLSAKIAAAYVAEADKFEKYNADAEIYAANVFHISTSDKDGNEQKPSQITDMVVNQIVSVGENAALLNLYNAKKADIMDALDHVDYSLYLDTVDPATGTTYLQQAQDKVANAKEDAKAAAMVLDEDGIDVSKVNTAVAAVKALVTGTVTPIMISGTKYESGLYKVVDVKTKEQVEADNRQDAADLAALKAQIQSRYVEILNDGYAKEEAEAYVVVANYLAENGFITKTPAFGSGKKNWTTPVKSIEELTAFAAKYKAEKDATGAFVRDAEAVDAEVAKATNFVYGTVAGSQAAIDAGQTISAAEKNIKDMSVKTAAAELAFAKETAKKALDDAKADVADTYYPLEAEKVNAKYAAILAEIEAADTLTKVTVAQNKIANAANGIDTRDVVDSKISWTVGSAAKADLDDVRYQIEHLNRGKTILDASYIDATDDQIKDALAEIYGEAGARTDKEIKALKTDTAAVAASLPTVGAKADAKKAVEDAINALPAKATESDLAKVEAAADAVDAYKALGGTVAANLTTKLNTAIGQVKTDMLKNLTIAYAQLDKTDKAAVKALQEKIYDAVGLAGGLFNDKHVFDTLKTNIDKALTDIRSAELADVIKAINAIPLNVTEADRATVEAARKAYDAFVAEWTSYDAPVYDAASQVTNFRELALAEAALSLNDNTEQNVYGTHVKINSKAAKGYIKISWDQKDNGVVLDGYEVYRSTKKTTGFKKISTFKVQKSKTYKTGMKKGTKYYYYVKGYKMVGDKKVYTHKSITVARTFR